MLFSTADFKGIHALVPRKHDYPPYLYKNWRSTWLRFNSLITVCIWCVGGELGFASQLLFSVYPLSLSDKAFTHLNSFGQIPLVSKLTAVTSLLNSTPHFRFCLTFVFGCSATSSSSKNVNSLPLWSSPSKHVYGVMWSHKGKKSPNSVPYTSQKQAEW